MAPKCPQDCDWPAHRMYLKETLETIQSDMRNFQTKQEARDVEIYKRLTGLQVEEGKLRVKSGMWGACATIVMTAAYWIKEHLISGGH